MLRRMRESSSAVEETPSDIEAIVFVPGFNSCLNVALSTCATFLTLGGYPTNTFPIVLQWPAQSILTYFQAKETAESDEMHARFLLLLHDLEEAGITRVNLIGHSMGARVLVSALRAKASTLQRPGSRLKIGALILANPETDLVVFKRAGQVLASVAESVTVYADRNDNALFWAELMNTALPTMETADIGFVHSLGRAASGPVYAATPAASPGTYQEEDLVDCDLIDTTHIQANVHKLRHSYFHLSRELLEDVRDIIVSRKGRASQRSSRLVQQEGNFYGWLIAPPHYHR